MDVRRKNSGFTLIELLAVIVILALLVLVAAPAVTDIMQKSAKSNFKNEVVGLVSQMENAFTSKMATSFSSGSDLSDRKIHNLTVDGKTYAYLCMTLDNLVTEKYTSKNLGTSYGGYIQMFIPNAEDEKTTTYVNVTNGRYYMQGQMNDVTSDDYLPSQVATGTAPAHDTTCPTAVSTMPTATNGSTPATP